MLMDAVGQCGAKNDTYNRLGLAIVPLCRGTGVPLRRK